MLRVSRLTPVAIALFSLTFAPTLRDTLAQQQKPAASANLEIDFPEIVAEAKEALSAYYQALNSGNIAVQNGTFRNDERTIRYGGAENLYGYKAIESFRAVARPIDPPLTLSKTAIATYGRDFAVTSTLVHRANQPGKVGRAMQTWVRFPEGLRVVAAHVSNIDEPK